MNSEPSHFFRPSQPWLRLRASCIAAAFWLLFAVPLWIPLPLAGMRGCTFFAGGLGITYSLHSCPYPIEPRGLGINLTTYDRMYFDWLSLIALVILCWAGHRAIRIYRRRMLPNQWPHLTSDARVPAQRTHQNGR